MSEIDFTKADALLEQAEELFDQAREYNHLASKCNRRATQMRNQAFEMITPFKIGDVIEYKVWIGYSPNRKLVSKRMKVLRMFRGVVGGIGVSGRQTDKNGEIGSHVDLSAELFSGRDSRETYVGIVKRGETK